jgi:hypothetical protein
MSSTGVADDSPTFKTFGLAPKDGQTALAGGGQSRTSLDTNYGCHRFTTVASANDSATLPTSRAGLILIVVNAAASNGMNVFPFKGDQINALGANNAFGLAANKTVLFIGAGNGQWHSLLTT